ncbi:hypothetical protein WJX81_000641 [Elliptochloris bilobata]|uniref:Delta(14)-sterol reductase ERG24 n=1 Tax=Elliptochloris bilobata TaxID=381761 RepID=A0AAW1S2D4_9CHLO
MGAGAANKQPEYEFLGPWIGPLGIILGLPAVCYFLVYACNSGGCLALARPLQLPGLPAGTALFSFEAATVVAAWVALQVGLHLAVPGKRRQGAPLPNGQRLQYKLTGTSNLVVTLAAALYFGFVTRQLNLGRIYDSYVPLMGTAIALSFAVSLGLYAASFRKGALLARGGSTGQPLYDFFMGRELNPRLGPLDLKEFCELTPGLLAWLLIDLGMAHKQLQVHGRVSSAMALVCGFHGLYVADALWHEPAILTTMDITTDGLGFMLAFGDLAWVPFTYSLQARYLVDHPQELSVVAVAGILALKALGYAIFRGANSQKDAFRRDPGAPGVRHLRTLQTASGRRLLISGWWGVARHINYLGDWLMGLAWCLPCGFRHVVPYFYAVYFGALLMHRDLRDEHACRLKYGRDWDRYCALVRYRLIPWVY